MFSHQILAGILTCIALNAASLSALANPRATEYLVDRLAFDLVMNESKELAVKEIAALMRNARTQMYHLPPEQLREVTARIGKIQERFEQTWSKSKRAKESELMPAEKAWLDEAISTELRINSKWRSNSPDTIEFLQSTHETGNFRVAREQFLKQPSAPALLDDATEVAVAARPKAVARFKNKIRKMEACRKHPFNAQRMSDFGAKYAITQLGVDELMTVGGAVLYSLVSSGEIDNVDLKMLPQELAFEAMESLRDSLVATRGGGTFRVRWFKMQAVGFGTSAVDMTVYHFNPNTDLPGTDKRRATINRGSYDTAWNVASGAISIKLFDLISGLECIDVHGAYVVGAQVAAGLGINVAYFGLRAVTNTTAD